MYTPSRTLLALTTLAVLALPVAAQQTWPQKPIRLVTPFSAGGPGDDTARVVAEGLTKKFGQQVIVDNKAGAGGIIGADAVAKAPSDGYTLLAGANGTLTNSLIRPKMPYAPGDLTPVTGIATTPSLIVVRNDVKATTLKELQAVAKRESAGMFFATTGIGSTSHFSGEIIETALGVKLTFIPHKSGGESMMALMAGQVQIVSEVPSVALVELVKSGKARALAVAGDHRLASLPDVPTTAEAGFPQIRMSHWLGLFAPRNTPPALLDKLNAAVQEFIGTEQMRQFFAARNQVPMLGDRAAFAHFVEDESKRLGKIAKDFNIVAE